MISDNHYAINERRASYFGERTNWKDKVQIFENFNENFNVTKQSSYHFIIGSTNSNMQIFSRPFQNTSFFVTVHTDSLL